MSKKLLKNSLLIFGVFFALACANAVGSNCSGDEYGKTNLFVRPNFQLGMPEVETFWRKKAKVGCCGQNYAECAFGGAIQVVGFGGRSTKSDRLGSYFMFGGGNTLTVSTTSGSAQVNPAHFGVVLDVTPTSSGSFSGTITFNPRQSFAGVGFEWRCYFGWWDGCERNCDRRCWFDISFAFESIANNVNLLETVIATAGTPVVGAVANMTQALAGLATFGGTGSPSINPSGTLPRPMLFGLVPTGTNSHQSRRCIADVTYRIGLDACSGDCFYINGYVGGLAPTGNRPRGRFIFEPIVGHNRHAGFVFGGLMSFDIYKCDYGMLSLEINNDSVYLFRGIETRSFDLVSHGPWSRYLLIYASPPDAASAIVSPGINFFTQDFNVTPRGWTSMNVALLYNGCCGLEVEVGWNFWAKNAEHVTLREPLPTGIFVAELDPTNVQVANTTNLLSTIGNNNSCVSGGVDCTYNPTIVSTAGSLTLADIDCRSATNGAALSNMLYGALCYNLDCCFPLWVGIGGSYEFAAVNTALSRWNIWAKWGISF